LPLKSRELISAYPHRPFTNKMLIMKFQICRMDYNHICVYVYIRSCFQDRRYWLWRQSLLNSITVLFLPLPLLQSL